MENEVQLLEEPRRVLVVANETSDGTELHEALRFRVRASRSEVRVVVPALNSPLRHWLSDEDEARRRAEARLARCLSRLGAAGIAASGHVGDADPLLAIADELHAFPAEEIVISTHPPSRSRWLARDLVDRARTRFGLPVTHLVVGSADAPARGPMTTAISTGDAA